MSLTNAQYKKIVDFLDAAMTLDEMTAFEKELTTDSELRTQLDFELTVREGLSIRENSSPAAAGDTGFGKHTSTAVVKINRKRFAWMAAAAFLLLFAGIKFILRKDPVPPAIVKNDKNAGARDSTKAPVRQIVDSLKIRLELLRLYTRYYKKDVLPEAYPMVLAEALNGYEKGDFEYIKNFNLADIPQTRGSDAINTAENIRQLGHYYKGLAYLQTNNLPSAIINLQWVLKNAAQKQLFPKAAWYLALAHIKNNDTSSALELLYQLKDNSSNVALRKKAGELIQALQKQTPE